MCRVNHNILFSFFLFVSNCSSAQWVNLGTGFNNPGRCMLLDTVTQEIIVGGNFDQAGTSSANGIALWNGINWSPIGLGAPYGAPVYSITKFQNSLFASSIFQNNPSYQNWLSKWNGSTWDTISPGLNGPVACFKEYNGDLYLGGAFHYSPICNANMIARFDGVTFHSFAFPATNYSVNAIEFFQGNMYIGGNFFDTIQQVNDLEVWDGTIFKPFGINGLASGVDFVNSMAVYNDELYIGGWFTNMNGDPANFIMKWDGQQFHEVGGGLNGPVSKIKSYSDGLYVCGNFTLAGQLPAPGIVKWDGNQWISLCDTFQNYGITDFVKVGGDLYITGGIDSIGLIDMNYVAKLQGSLSIYENNTDREFSFSIKLINCENNLELSISELGSSRFIFQFHDISGRLLLNTTFQNTESPYTIKLPNLTKGIYFVTLQNNYRRRTKKLIKF